MRYRVVVGLLPVVMFALVAIPAWSDDVTRQAEPLGLSAGDVEFFERLVRPILVEHCAECHAATSKKIGGGLRLDSREGLHTGGDSGSAVVPGDPDASLLIQAVRYRDESLQMPPTGKLSDQAIATLEEWVRRGAPDPRVIPPQPVPAAPPWDEVMRQRAQWWSLLPLRHELPPAVSAMPIDPTKPPGGNRYRNDLDAFVLAKLQEHHLAPAVPAPPTTLLRRLTLVLTGLPPTPEEMSDFLHECHIGPTTPMRSDQVPAEAQRLAVARLVDRLLQSPHFGERWARHWLDVVRFTETHGNEWNYEVHHAWRYRDYLIRAFNQDVPYDQFVREHIAGDLLESPRWNSAEQLNESIIATAFFRFGEVNHDDCISLRELGFDIADNQIDTLTKAFQATTVSCARCHDHKLDAVSMRDYYGLLGILRSSRLVAHTLDAPQINAEPIRELGELKKKMRKELVRVWRQDAEQLSPGMLAAEAAFASKKNAESPSLAREVPRLAAWLALLARPSLPDEHPLAPWHKMVHSPDVSEAARMALFRAEAERYVALHHERETWNRHFETFADFRDTVPANWQSEGQSRPSSSGEGRAGDFIVATNGTSVLTAILPAGYFTHRLSDKLNATLRSPVFPFGKQQVSIEVMGQFSSAVRLVSNNCQLNYKNYRALTQPQLHWVTFELPDDRDSLRTYAELMTKFDNPKFPDQLSALGGDPANYRVPWETAVEDPRSYFGVTRIVLHDAPEPPQAELSHLMPLWQGLAVGSTQEVRQRYRDGLSAVLDRWEVNQSTDDDVRWLDAFLKEGLLSNQAVTPELQALCNRYRLVESQLSIPRVAPGLSEGEAGEDHCVFTRGDCRRPGEVVPRGYLEVLASATPGPVDIPSNESGRRQLAEQIASPLNPLTARVIVNRVWHHLFGTGIVKSVDDFGHVGELPSHPELLDYLANRFIENEWSIKWLIREIVLSNTFQLSSAPSHESRQHDPGNRWLQHYPARRMEAEAIRDSMLAMSGGLRDQLYGLSIQPYRDQAYVDRRLFPGPLDGAGRRSIYIKNNLMESPKFLAAFNFPGGKVAQGRRDVTNVPAQALTLLNDPFVMQQAGNWANHVSNDASSSATERLASMLEFALQRTPTEVECQSWEDLVMQLAELHGAPKDQVLQSPLIWKDVAHAIFNLKEFIYIP